MPNIEEWLLQLDYAASKKLDDSLKALERYRSPDAEYRSMLACAGIASAKPTE
ncbi:MAG: hypothetical protein N2C14_33530 [Planctomycetales bacterium]